VSFVPSCENGLEVFFASFAPLRGKSIANMPPPAPAGDLTSRKSILHSFIVSSTYSITEGQARFPRVVKEAQAGYVATITKRNEPVAYVIGNERMSAIVETMEILANPAAMKAIRANEAGKLKSYRVEDILE